MPRRCACLSGLTLLELVLAMEIATFLACLSISTYTHFIDSTAIDGGAQTVSDALTEARQDAVTQNNTIEVRLYAAPDGKAYDALQLRWHNADGTMPAVAPVAILPAEAVIDATPSHLVLTTIRDDAPTTDPSDPRFNSATRCFHFLPDGSTDLATTGMVTIRAATQSDPTKFPANWACIEVDSMTGRTQVYRP